MRWPYTLRMPWGYRGMALAPCHLGALCKVANMARTARKPAAPATTQAQQPAAPSTPAPVAPTMALVPPAPALVALPTPPMAPSPLQALAGLLAPATQPAAPAPAQGAAPVLRNGGILATALPANLRPCTGQACPAKMAALVMVAAPKAALPRAPHVALWVQAALANLAAAGGRATGAQLVAPVALPVPAPQAQAWGLVPAQGQPGHYMVHCPGHVLVYVYGKQFVRG